MGRKHSTGRGFLEQLRSTRRQNRAQGEKQNQEPDQTPSGGAVLPLSEARQALPASRHPWVPGNTADSCWHGGLSAIAGLLDDPAWHRFAGDRHSAIAAMARQAAQQEQARPVVARSRHENSSRLLCNELPHWISAKSARSLAAFLPMSLPPTRDFERACSTVPIGSSLIRMITSSLKRNQKVVSVASMRPSARF